MAKSSDQPAYIKDIIKSYGNIILKGNQILEQNKDKKIVSVSPAIDLALNGGIKEGSWVMLSGPPKCGKAQPYSSLVYTPNGPKLMEDIEVGDIVCCPNNKYGKVLNTYPQGTKRVLKLIFNDGSSVRCDAEHLWKVRKNKKNSQWEIKVAEDLFIDTQYQDREKWIVYPAGSVSFQKVETKIPPYVLGVLLASNSLKTNLNVKTKRQHTLDKFTSLLSEAFPGSEVKNGEVLSKELRLEIERLGLNLQRSRRFIPDEFRYNSLENRVALIQGMLDSNGHAAKAGHIEYRVSSSQLAANMAEICRSLGCYVRTYQDRNGNVVCIYDGNVSYFGPSKPRNKIIKEIIECRDERCKCIEIDEPDHLYITDGVTSTHNTTTAMQLAYECQKENRPVIYLNTEGRLSDLNFEVEGLDPANIHIVTAEDKPLAAEIFLEVAYKFISVPENYGALCIIDSISSLIPAKDLEGEVSGTLRPGLPKILSNFVKKCGQIVPNNRNIMCLITHIIANTSGFGKSSMPDGGIKIQFQADTRMEVKKVSPWLNTDGNRIGQSVDWNIYYSGLGAKTYDCQSWIRYGKGIDKLQELLIIAQELGLINKAGSWMTCDYLLNNPVLLNKINPEIEIADGAFVDPEAATKACKMQGMEKLHLFFKENPIVIDELNNQVKIMLTV